MSRDTETASEDWLDKPVEDWTEEDNDACYESMALGMACSARREAGLPHAPEDVTPAELAECKRKVAGVFQMFEALPNPPWMGPNKPSLVVIDPFLQRLAEEDGPI